MFGEEFFPTPPWLVSKMFGPIAERIHGRRSEKPGSLRSFLDPSAGDGAILDWVNSKFDRYSERPRMSAIEISPELCAILQSKKYDLIANDFLSFVPEFKIDCIVMNPPFSDGIDHLIHAWNNVLAPGGELVCLLMESNVTRPHTSTMELAKHLIETHGSYELLGSAFKSARRPTEVPVVLVRMTKPKTKEEPLFDFGAMEQEKVDPLNLNAQAEGKDLAHPDRMGTVVRQYENTRDSFVSILKAQAQIRFFSNGVCTKDPWEIALKCMSDLRSPEAAFDEFKDAIRIGFWEHALQTLGMEKYMTEGLQKKMGEFLEQQSKMAFTKENIAKMFDTIMLNRTGIMQQAVEAVFDHMTKYNEENRIHIEGWATNLAWKVSKRVVMPFYIQFWMSGEQMCLNSSRSREAGDIDKVMCYLSGKRIEDVVTIRKAIDLNPRGSTRCESTFFKIKGFKKGTIHLEFLDEKLLERFNIAACQGKGWIGKEKS